MSLRPVPLRLLPLILALAAACGSDDGGGTPPTPSAPTVATVTVTAASSAPLLPGGTVQLSAKALTAAGAEVPTATITWSSGSTTIATVSASGLVTAVAAGSVTIIATSGAVTGTATVQVNPGGIVGNAGGTVTAANGGVTLQLPPGAVTTTTPITVTAKPDTVRTEHNVGPAYLFGPTGTTFAQPVIMALKYDTAQLPPYTDKAALRVARLTGGKWVPLTESVQVDSATNTVRAATRSFSPYGVVRDPCLPFSAGTGNITGQISAEDCLFSVAGRRSDYYALRPTAGQMLVYRGSGSLDGLFGLKEATADPTTGTVWNSNSAITSELRLVSNGDPLQLFVSGRDSTKFGSYTFTRLPASGHQCVTSTNGNSYIALMDGTSVSDTMSTAASCSGNIVASPFPDAIGKPIRFHTYPVRLLAGRRYTVTVTGVAPGQAALSLFVGGAYRQIIVNNTATRTMTVTPATTAYHFLEVSSGGVTPGGTAWTIPEFRYTLTVSRGEVVTP
jgi:hypothetical protein